MTLELLSISNAVQSHAMACGWYDRVDGHEPKNAPGNGVTAAVWVDALGPVPAGSGLSETAGRVVLMVRTYMSMLAEDQDRIDPNVISAVDAMMRRITGDFTLDGTVRNVDLLGQAGPAMSGRAGYINQDGKLFRIFDLSVPVIVNDLWSQAE